MITQQIMKRSENIIREGKKSRLDWKSSDHPFNFGNYSDNKPTYAFNYTFYKNIPSYNVIYDLPPLLHCIYNMFNDKSSEFYYHDWTFLSLKEATDVYEKINKTYHIFDFATKYHGMGWL